MDHEKTEDCGVNRITADSLIKEALNQMPYLNGPEAVAVAARALNDMNKAGALRVRLPTSFTVAQEKAAELDGNPYPSTINVVDHAVGLAPFTDAWYWYRATVDAEERVTALEAENTRLNDELKLRTDDRNAWSSQCAALMTERDLLRQALAAKDARIAQLKSIIASTPVAFEDPDAKPAPEPGFLRAIRQGNKATVGFPTKPGDMPHSNE